MRILKYGFYACTIASAVLVASAQDNGNNNGFEIVRIPTSGSSKCINSATDEITLSVYRVILEKKGGFLTSDHSAGIAVTASLNGSSVQVSAPGATGAAAQPAAGGAQQPVSAQIPSVKVVPISGENNGQVFVPIEYAIASNFALSQANTQTKTQTNSMQLNIYAEKVRGKSGFGTIVTDAASLIGTLPIPPSPYLTVANQFLTFANHSIQDDASQSSNATLIATINLPFANQDYDLQSCIANADSYTGAIAVVAATGAKGQNFLTLGNLSQRYCWRYESDNTFEIQYAAKPASGCANVAESQWNELSNDYTMLLLTGGEVPSNANIGAPNIGAKAANVMDVDRLTQSVRDLGNAKSVCDSLKVSPALCGVGGGAQ